MDEQFIIRPVRLDDLDDIFAMAEKAKPGLTNLPPDRDLLTKRINWSLESFAKKIDKPENELYFFVMEELHSGKVIGTCGIFSDVGDEFYSFKVSRELAVCEQLNIRKENHYLQLVNDYKNVSEMALLLLDSKYRKKKLGKLLSRSRYLFLADNQEKFHSRIIAEMRGELNIWGHSVFWNNVGRKFIDMDFEDADMLSSTNQKRFIAELFPHSRIPICLLSKDAQRLIGKPHHDTKAAMDVLKREGFERSNYVDIFDAGPTLEARLKNIQTFADSKLGRVAAIEDSENNMPGLASFQGDTYRVAQGALRINDDESIVMSTQLAQNLCCKLGDTVRYILT